MRAEALLASVLAHPALRSSFPAFVALFAALYGGFGLESPFLPTFFSERGLSASEIGAVLAAGTAVRLVAGPTLGHLADRVDAPGRVLAIAASFAGTVGLLYLAVSGFWPFLLISMAHATSIASLAPLADALALAASLREKTFSYGWVRGVGSAVFILGTLAAGQLVARFGIASIILSSSALFLFIVPPVRRIPVVSTAGGRSEPWAWRRLLAIPLFPRLLLVAGLVIGSQAMSDGFAVILWRQLHFTPEAISLLWSEAVLAEVVVFLVLGNLILDALGPAGSVALAAAAGILRWTAFAETSSLSVIAAVQLLQGFTFALTHLACMRLIGEIVPPRLLATAQAVYGTLFLGFASVVLTLVSGPLYQAFGARGFWLMALLCLLALPLALTLRPPDEGRALAEP